MNNTDDHNFILKDSDQSSADSQAQLPAIDFSTFIFSLNSSALVHLGAIADPTTGQTNQNLIVAKQTIDILGVLEEKTRGNLTQEESNLLTHMLHDLRLQYVKSKKGDQSS
ncbi:MAG: DUF1844 domain-containing protein [Desulfosudaceae bacterium]